MLTKVGIADFTATVVPFLHITTHIEGKEHDGLLQQKGFGGFPTLCLMSAEGEVLYQLYYTEQSLEGFAAAVANTTRMLELQARPASDAAAKKALLMLQLDMRKLPFAAAVAAADHLDFDAAERAAFEARLVEILARLKLEDARKLLDATKLSTESRARGEEILSDLEIKEAMAPLLRGFRPGTEPPWHICYELWQSGKLPSDKPLVDSLYWSGVLRHADKLEDARAYAAAAAKVLPTLDDNKSYADSIRKRLAELQGK